VTRLFGAFDSRETFLEQFTVFGRDVYITVIKTHYFCLEKILEFIQEEKRVVQVKQEEIPLAAHRVYKVA
jgi:hypothetical protein